MGVSITAPAALALNYLSSNVGSYTQDVVGVYDANFNQLFPNARPITAKVNPTAKLMEHTLESGASIADHRIINPIEIELNVILLPSDYIDAYTQIKGVFLGNTSVTIETLTDVYSNMYIEAMPYDHTPEVINTVTMIIKFKEALIANTQTQTVTVASVANPADSSTVAAGAQNGITQTAPSGSDNSANGTSGSVLYNWFYGNSN